MDRDAPNRTALRRQSAVEERKAMALKERGMTIPELMLIAGTRIALGIGIGLLIGDRLNSDQRKAAGWALPGFGIATTIPLVRGVLDKPAIGQ